MCTVYCVMCDVYCVLCTGVCKHCTSNTATFYGNGLRENNGYGIRANENECDELQHHNQEKLERRAKTTSSSPCTTSTPMTTLTSTIAWRTTCIESAHIAHCSQSLLMIHIAHSWLKSERFHTPSMVIHMAHSP